MSRVLEREVAERATHQAEGHRARALKVLEREAVLSGHYVDPAAVLRDLQEARDAIDAAAVAIMEAWPHAPFGGKAAA
jgi:hypothetical protein